MQDKEAAIDEGVVDVELLLQNGAIPPKLADRIRAADANQDGRLSVLELVEVMRREQKAVEDRKLFRNIMLALLVAVLVLIATLCGTVYGIVKLTQEVNDQDGLLVSASTGEVMGTGLAQEPLPLSRLYRFGDSSELRNVESVIVASKPDEGSADGSEEVQMFRVSKISAVPNVRATVYTVDGSKLEVDDTGVRVVDQDNDVTQSSGGRRLSETAPVQTGGDGTVPVDAYVVANISPRSNGCDSSLVNSYKWCFDNYSSDSDIARCQARAQQRYQECNATSCDSSSYMRAYKWCLDNYSGDSDIAGCQARMRERYNC
ncbi:hypothetical protein PSENEW3_00003217 [Picochlorum sp. SENEW3]|nr:hypothetical protein PSENEW3_00003217 [Picochlorum sp. SENEW3]